ncbi:MAG: hypothetical protein ACR2GX_07680 [Candidatus Dormibacteria bacterium]
MQLIEAYPVPTPADAERMLANLWQLTSGRAIGLYVFGFHGDRVMLGTHCHHPMVEEATASIIADQTGGAIEPGWAISQMVEVADETAVVNLVPTDRHLALDSKTFGWQRTDPLRGVFTALGNLPSDTVAGIGLTLRALPDLSFVVSLAAFACGANAGLTCVRIASSYGGVGVRLRRPFRQKRAIGKVLDASMRRPQSIKRVEVAALFWHPPYGQEAPLVGERRPAAAPVGYLNGSTQTSG